MYRCMRVWNFVSYVLIYNSFPLTCCLLVSGVCVSVCFLCLPFSIAIPYSYYNFETGFNRNDNYRCDIMFLYAYCPIVVHSWYHPPFVAFTLSLSITQCLFPLTLYLSLRLW